MLMRIQIKNTIKTISPGLFKFLKNIQELRRTIKKRLPLYSKYYAAIILKKPYWGQLYGGGGYNPNQSKGILLKKAVQICGGTKCLEIGSWTGGSSMIMGNELKRIGKGILYCVDTWKGAPNYDAERYDRERNALNRDWVYKTFLRNIKVSRLNSYVIPIRKSSNNAIKDFPKESFDLVFIDGDHAYGQFKRDLENYKELVKVDGILCGDDLEKLLPEVDKELTVKNKEEDWLFECGGYHPGITLAINEVFNDQVGVKDSFWAVRRTDTGWKKLDL